MLDLQKDNKDEYIKKVTTMALKVGLKVRSLILLQNVMLILKLCLSVMYIQMKTSLQPVEALNYTVVVWTWVIYIHTYRYGIYTYQIILCCST